MVDTVSARLQAPNGDFAVFQITVTWAAGTSDCGTTATPCSSAACQASFELDVSVQESSGTAALGIPFRFVRGDGQPVPGQGTGSTLADAGNIKLDTHSTSRCDIGQVSRKFTVELVNPSSGALVDPDDPDERQAPEVTVKFDCQDCDESRS